MPGENSHSKSGWMVGEGADDLAANDNLAPRLAHTPPYSRPRYHRKERSGNHVRCSSTALEQGDQGFVRSGAVEGPLGTPHQSTTLTSLCIVSFARYRYAEGQDVQDHGRECVLSLPLLTVRAFKADLDLSTPCSVVAGSPVIGTSSFIPRCLQSSTDL